MTRRPLAALAVVTSAVLLLAGCSAGGADPAEASSDYVTAGKLTIGTGGPAYYPWVQDDAPESGQGFEAAVAYAVAEELGFARGDVEWVRTTFDQAIAPGPKDFDVNLQQFSITTERADAVDFSSPYYETTQVVITVEDSPAAAATAVADLRGLLIGAQAGSTSLDAVEEVIQPTAGARVFDTNDDAKLALQNGMVDALVVDLPTAFFLTTIELEGEIVGQLPKTSGGDRFGLVLAKGSPLTERVTAAVDALRADGTLDELAAEWLGGDDAAPELE